MPHIHATQFGKGVWVPSIDALSETLYDTSITDDGGLTLRRPDGSSCTLEPLESGNRGFAAGTRVDCEPGSKYQVRASDDPDHGEVRVSLDGQPTETYRYDVDTSVLLSAEPPLPGTKPGKAPSQ